MVFPDSLTAPLGGTGPAPLRSEQGCLTGLQASPSGSPARPAASFHLGPLCLARSRLGILFRDPYGVFDAHRTLLSTHVCLEA